MKRDYSNKFKNISAGNLPEELTIKNPIEYENKFGKWYIDLVKRTESPYDIPKDINKRLMHAILGISTESGELVDAIKKYIFYNKSLNNINLVEEVGDLLWYIAIICDVLDISFEEVMKKNIAKLRVRYPEEFNEAEAELRDLDKELEALK
ncbi:nucleoside triphosphate pyrophosphohydrolase family protein [Candidatus Pacearchaeota archaeon]|jgi:NTP pyrophosphatase (non-canonical NTP hydrolase)|nr:nucleoside triphosphate pyrophosphohydrolase family protein [Candidatus Pacearchaeota archaeon]